MNNHQFTKVGTNIINHIYRGKDIKLLVQAGGLE